MPTYKLTYFDMRGLGEGARFLFQLAGVEYEDVRLTPEQWKEMKSKMGLGALPVLEVDGKELVQSRAIYNYLALELGFMPKDAWDRAQVEMVIETLYDLVPGFGMVFLEKDEKKKAEAAKKFLAEDCPKHLNNAEKLLKKNNGGKGWFFGDKITLADIVAFSFLHDGIPFIAGMEIGDLSYLKDQVLLKGLADRMKKEPKMAEWLKKRPQTKS